MIAFARDHGPTHISPAVCCRRQVPAERPSPEVTGMKTSAVRKLRRQLAADRPAFGMWITLESPSVTEMAVALGVDWVLIDAEHGHLDWNDICAHIRATVRSETVALVRLSELNIALVKRALDLGADGIVIPWIETAEQLRQAVAFARFPPQGLRGIGGERATGWGQCFVEHAQEANDHVLVVPMIESVKAGQNIESLAAVDGVELFLIGPADFSSTAGFRGQWEGPGVAEQLLTIKDKIRAAGKHCGLIATSNDNLQQRVEQGFRLPVLGVDTSFLLRGLHGALATVGRDRAMRAEFTVPAEVARVTTLDSPPASYRPDRGEMVTTAGQGPTAEIGAGVSFECLVGKSTGAKNLTTGLVTMDAGSLLDYHTHTCSESVTLLAGSVALEVEGRRYTLGLLDNIVIPAGLAHAAFNLDTGGQSVLHVALATADVDRVLVENVFTRRQMPNDSSGVEGAEYVARHRMAERRELGSGTSSIDFFNADLVPGIEMSGGHAQFIPGGRLPAHVHDFDESICIVQGTATCIVEGRRHKLSGVATAMVPRGRVHYFTNETNLPMAMIWVYAGPRPERIVVDERCATIDGNPWR
jgi:2-keto-3-deoxy-L-rhamnonate aldolase RhmA/quercetin dioxygenase-like cupin family protein